MNKLSFLAAVLLATAAHAANQPNPACAQVRAACEQAGFVEGGKAKGIGLIVDCVQPLVKGTAQRPMAKKPLPQVSADAIASCRGGAAEAQQVSPQELEQLKQSNTLIEVGQTKPASDLTAQNKGIIDDFVKAHPEHAARANLEVDTSVATDLGGDDYLLKSSQVLTMGPNKSREILADSISLADDPQNMAHVYALEYGAIASFNSKHPNAKIEQIGTLQISQMPSPSSASGDQIKSALKAFTDYSAVSAVHDKGIATLAQEIEADRHLTSCDGNTGFGDGGDREDGKGKSLSVSGADSCATFASDGVMANYTFPARPYVSCVKNQAHRGTCWSFAMTSAFEMYHAWTTALTKGTAEFVDLSEQDLVANEKLNWHPEPGFYGDGDSPSKVLKSMIATGYRQPYEKSWDYNGARSRDNDKDNDTYTHSCDGYSESCSNTDHQAKHVCSGGKCYYVLPSVSGGLKAPTGYGSLWQSNPQDTVPLLIISSFLQLPVVIAISTYPEFDDASKTSGWVAVPKKGQTNGGGHVIHLVGWISNETLASSKALSKHPHDSSTGGGYFIIKNSWGTCKGDAGYWYVPASYLTSYLTGAMIIG